MKILISPAKEMIKQKHYNVDWKISETTSAIVYELKSKKKDELKQIFKITDKTLLEVSEYIKCFDISQTYTAIELYNGLAYKSLKENGLSDKSISYLNDNLLIISALYGFISPNTKIKPYRLDMMSNLKINNISLKNIWKPVLNKSLAPKEFILNLASDEFSNLLEKENYNWLDFEFYEKKNETLKKHSTISKKARGKMVKFLAENNIKNKEDIKNFNYDNFHFSKELSNENLFVFIKNK